MSNCIFSSPRRLRRSRNGIVFGVFQGLADYAEINVFWLRFFAIVLLFTTGFFPIIAGYLVAALILRPGPDGSSSGDADPADEEFETMNRMARDRRSGLARIRERFHSLESRTRNLEEIVTDREFDWEQRLNTGQ